MARFSHHFLAYSKLKTESRVMKLLVNVTHFLVRNRRTDSSGTERATAPAGGAARLDSGNGTDALPFRPDAVRRAAMQLKSFAVLRRNPVEEEVKC